MTANGIPSAWHVAAIKALPPAERLAHAGALLDALDRTRGALSLDACDLLLEALDGAGRDRLGEWIRERDAGPATLYAQARLLSASADRAAAADAWERVLSHAPAPDAVLALHAARALARAGRSEQAAARLRAALALRPPYSFHARAQGLVSQLWAAHRPSARRARIAVLGATTTSLLVPVLRALAFRDGVDAEFYEGLYGAYRQEILDPSSGFHRFAPTITFIVTHWRDLALPPLVEDEDAFVNRVAGEYEQLWKTIDERAGGHVVQHAFDLPLDESHDYVAAARRGGRTRCLELINLELARRAPGHVSILDAAAVESEVGKIQWHDATAWHTARQHPSPLALPALAEAQMAHVRAVAGLSRKVVVCDLDNTLWGGIIGEDGLNGIRIGPGSPVGEAHLRLQEYLLELKSRGVLLAVCSKNNPDDARLPFERHPRMRLRLDDFVAFVANWRDKVENLRAIAQMVSLGADSFVFLDDNPLERAWVRAQMPEVAVPEIGSAPYGYVSELDRGRYFFSLTLTEEDRQRAELYRRDTERQALRGSFASLEDFLEQLQMRASDMPVDAANLARVTQLVNKTNQFNLTTRRHQAGEIEEMARRTDGWSRAFSLSDRFGDHGLIGVILCVPGCERTWEIETWVMSCRVLGRGMERFMFDRLLEAARAAGVERIAGVYRPTKKNAQVAELYSQLGFAAVSSTAEESRFEFDVRAGAAPHPHAIELAATA